MRLLAVIPARGGSKGLPGKNVAPLGGKPLIAWTVEAARGARSVARTIVSTDDDAIAAAARAAGAEVPFRRPAVLSGDTATTLDVVLHALDACPGFTHVAVLQPTSPLRRAAHVDGAVAAMQAAGADSVVSLCPVSEPPWWMYTLGEAGRMQPLLPAATATRRQDLPPVYILNGAIYVTEVARLRACRAFVDAATIGYPMEERDSVDIDTAADLEEARRRLNEDI
jgi:CMP-N-acetylneuraminic acid synthetase